MISLRRHGHRVSSAVSLYHQEEIRLRWDGRTSNPVGGAMRCRVGSTPILFRQSFLSTWFALFSCGRYNAFRPQRGESRDIKSIDKTFRGLGGE